MLEELVVRLRLAIEDKDEFGSMILIARLFELGLSENDLQRKLISMGMIKSSTCFFCAEKCNNPSCDLEPVGASSESASSEGAKQ